MAPWNSKKPYKALQQDSNDLHEVLESETVVRFDVGANLQRWLRLGAGQLQARKSWHAEALPPSARARPPECPLLDRKGSAACVRTALQS